MKAVGSKRLADALGLTVPQIQQWMVRGFLTPEGPEGSGRRARQWPFRDALRVQVCRQVVRSRIPASDYNSAVEAAVNAPEDCLLVIEPAGDFGSHIGIRGHKVEYFDVYTAIAWRIATSKEVIELVARHGCRCLTIIDIAALAAELRAALEFRERSGGEPVIIHQPEASKR